MGPAIRIQGLTRRFGSFTAVDDVSFEVQPGEVFGLLGSNGAGKSTVIRMLCGLMRPTAGEARVLGVDVAARPEEVKRGLGYMTQRFSLYEDLTVRQNLTFFGGVYGLRGPALRERAGWAVAMAGLEGREDALARGLPGGWRQRLALACSVLHRPRLLLLDEPTGGVDPISRRRFWELIERMAAEGVTILVTTHSLDEAEHCGRIALMHAGRVVALGSVAELKEVFAGRAVLEVSCPRWLEAMRRLETLEGVGEVSPFGDRLHVVVADPGRARGRIEAALAASGNVPMAIERIVPSLEDVFIHYVETAGGRGGET
ncbi:MAG TPA: ABC transporter ATP-binding protein [Candidatus Polarisedimenticolia bacterium]|nr:ABC transporter ATP-binding protein [Candidatus Polarisedimenticolia bacterium]